MKSCTTCHRWHDTADGGHGCCCKCHLPAQTTKTAREPASVICEFCGVLFTDHDRDHHAETCYPAKLAALRSQLAAQAERIKKLEGQSERLKSLVSDGGVIDGYEYRAAEAEMLIARQRNELSTLTAALAEARKMPEDAPEILQSAIARWGELAQFDMAIEECAELIKAIMHLIRGRANKAMVAEEVADVTIMCEQLRVMIGVDLVDKEISRKLIRLKGRIAEKDGAIGGGKKVAAPTPAANGGGE